MSTPYSDERTVCRMWRRLKGVKLNVMSCHLLFPDDHDDSKQKLSK